MTKNFKSVISVLLAVLLVISSAVCGVAVNDATDAIDETTTVVENTEVTEENTTEPSEEETTTEAPSEEETTEPSTDEPVTEPSEEETTTEAPSEEETTEPSTEAPSEEETTEPSTEAPSEEETTEPSTEAPSEEETTEPSTDEPVTEPSEEETTTEAPSEEKTTEPSTEAPSEEETTEPSTDEPVTEPSEEETTTEAPSEEETTEPSTEAPSEEETTEPSTDEPVTEPSEEETTTEAPSEEETTEPSTEAPSEEETTEPSTDEPVTEPSNPEEPSDPEQPSDPEAPTDPEQPSDPEEPSDPEQPEDPTDPSEPEDPTDPEKPSEPDEPEVPETIKPADVDITLSSGKKGVVIKWADAFDFLGDDYAYGVGYRIYRKTDGSSWKRIATVADVVEYTDTTAAYGVTYKYVIRAFYNTAEGEIIIGGYDEDGFEIAPNHVITPAITEVSLQKNRYIKIVWTAIPGVTKYALYRATTPDGKYTKIYVGTIRKFADKTATPGETYYYKVKAYTDDKGSSASAFASYIYKVAAPTISSTLSTTSTSVTLKWSKVKGADGYKIYRKTSDGDAWVRIKTVKSGDTTSYVNKNLNGKYIYAIRAYHKDGDVTVNGPLSASVKVRTLDKIKTVKVTTDKKNYTNTVKWSKVSGATGYQLYAKVAGGEWEHIITTESGIRSFSHLVSANTIHYYKIRAVYGSSVASFSDAVKSDINIIPNFTVTLPSKKISKPEYITVKVKNNTKKDMTIYAAGATYAYGEDTYTLVMSKSTKENFVENVKIPSGKTVTVYMFPYDYVDNYRTDGAVGFLIETNNEIFIIASSVVYGTQAYYYGSTK